MTIISISLEEWFTYCYWNFGLTVASTTLSNSAFKNEQTIADVRKDACHGLKDEIQDECPHFCDFPTRFEIGGALILFVVIISIISQIFSLFYHVLRYRRMDIRFDCIWFLIALSFLLQFIGFIGYYFICGFIGMKSVTDKETQKDSPNDFEWKGGLILYTIVWSLQFVLMVFGEIFTRKGFKVINST